MSNNEEGEAVVNALYKDAPATPGAIEAEAAPEQCVFQVSDLSYTPPKRLGRYLLDTFRRKLTEYNMNWVAPSLRAINSNNFHDVPLRRVNFSAVGGELTAIIGGSSDRHELINLLSGRMNSGEFDGQVLLSGPGITKGSYYYDKMAFVQRVSATTR